MVGMKHGSNPRRGRSRGSSGSNSGNNKRHQPSRNHTHESNGPEGKVRGSAQQVYDKYLSLARDATTAGENIAAEGYYQYAEHYYRLANIDAANNQARNQQQQGDQQPSDQQPDGQQNQSGDAVPEATSDAKPDAKSDNEDQPKVRRNTRKPREASADVEGAASGGPEASPAKEANADADSSSPKDADASDDAELAASA